MIEFVRVAETRQIRPGLMKTVEVHGDGITVANLEGVFFAFSNSCTHDGGPLFEGELEGELITCPWHFSRFSVKTGEVIDSPADDPIRTYPVKIENGAVFIGVPAA
jgi:3-phenylpropionate/trans-cinnamate dioxygenase ferredoxin component